MVVCTKCGLEKEECEFRARPTLKRGYHSWCRMCEKEGDRSRYIPKPKKVKIINHNKVKEDRRLRNLKYRYNLDYDDYNKMYEDQDGKCAICGLNKDLGTSKGLLVDHCHETNKVRGLLCNNCNSGLGKFMDNIELLNNAINYLQR